LGKLQGKTGVGVTEKCIFSCCLNVSRDGEEVMSEGKLFHIHAPVTGNSFSLLCVVCMYMCVTDTSS